MGCSIILEGCNKTPHNGVTELHNGSSITLLGEYDSYCDLTPQKGIL